MNTLDLAGIGIGPFNLSLAALLEPVNELSSLFLERRPAFAWHPDQLLPGAKLQTSFLKDLVTPVDPTSRHSFLNYLVSKKRFYEFLNADHDAILRAEFADYLGWTASRLDNLRFDRTVQEIRLEGDRLRVMSSGGAMLTRAVVIGTGKTPYRPAWAANLVPGSALHASHALGQLRELEGRSVAVVGGGQSGAELFLAIARGEFGRARQISWISRRPTFAALDETHFVNEWFTPAFVEHFHALPAASRRTLRPIQKLAGDGISVATIQEIYQHLYERRHIVGDGDDLSLLPAREVVDAVRAGATNVLTARSMLDGHECRINADIVVLATGFAWSLPACLTPLAGRLALEDGMPRLNLAYRAIWDGPGDARIYLQNAGLHSHGIADPQLSLMAWRAAAIVNDLAGRPVYDIDQPEAILQWGDLERRREARALPRTPTRIAS